MNDKLHIGIVASKFNKPITDALVIGAEVFLREKYMKEATSIDERGDKNILDEKDYSISQIPSLLLTSYYESKTVIDMLPAMPPRITLLKVPGAYELPQGIQQLIEIMQQKNNKLDGVVAVGAIIRGHTPHFDYIASTATQGIMQTGLKYNVPVGFGVITANSYEEAEQRASLSSLESSSYIKVKEKAHKNKAMQSEKLWRKLVAEKEKAHKNKAMQSNKGYEAALAVWQMIIAARKLSAE